MSRIFGNCLPGNQEALAANHSQPSAEELVPAFGELDEQLIILRKEDFRADDTAAPLLHWSTFGKGEIALQLKDTEGLADGRVTIKASRLQKIHPALLPLRLDSEYLFSISLEKVVLQVEAHLRRKSEKGPDPVGLDFDTSIAQAAREDEGFFRLAKIAQPKETPFDESTLSKRKTSGPILTPADRPVSPVLRKKSAGENRSLGFGSCSSAVIPRPLPAAWSETEAGLTERASQKVEAVEQSSLKRIGQERLREIFMTEDQLDAPQVASLLGTFPKVNSALVMLGDGAVLGGTLPDGYDLETALLVPTIMQNVRKLSRRLGSQETAAFTLLGDRLVTLFADGNVYYRSHIEM